jgi:hypothetical protein
MRVKGQGEVVESAGSQANITKNYSCNLRVFIISLTLLSGQVFYAQSNVVGKRAYLRAAPFT